MKHNSDFRYDLELGKSVENQLSKILTDKRIEVKMDKIAHRTGNIAIEYECRGKPSGIAVTEAEYYAYVIPMAPLRNIILLMEVEYLKRLSRLHFLEGKIKKMGDSNLSNAVLIPINDLFIHHETKQDGG